MSLEQLINDEIKNAMRAKAEARLRALRAIKSAILLAKTAEGASDPLSADDEMKILTKLSKQRRDSLEVYQTQNRPDLAVREQEELDVIQEFLPKQLSADELRAEIQQIIAETGATSAKDMGKVIGAANKALAGKAEGKTIAAIVKELLS
jgi:uncharacterized protein YqeY